MDDRTKQALLKYLTAPEGISAKRWADTLRNAIESHSLEEWIYAFNDQFDFSEIALGVNAMALRLADAERERDELRGLLEEVEVCPHPEAAEQFRKSGGRAWCCQCSNYVRSENDVTLAARVQAALSPTSPPFAPPPAQA